MLKEIQGSCLQYLVMVMVYGNFQCNLKNTHFGAPEWLSQLSIWLLILAQVMISWFMSSSPASGSVLTACFGFCVSISLCLFPAHALSLSHSLKNNVVLKKMLYNWLCIGILWHNSVLSFLIKILMHQNFKKQRRWNRESTCHQGINCRLWAVNSPWGICL